MTRYAGLVRRQLALGLALLAILLVHTAACAQERLEIVPRIDHTDSANSAAFSPNGAQVLSGSSDKTLKLWDAATARLIRTFNGHSDSVVAVAFSPDGTQVLSGSQDATLKLWEVMTGRLIRTLEGHSAGVTSVAFSPDGDRVTSGSSDGTVKMWDTATGQLVRTFQHIQSSLTGVTAVAFSPNGDRVLSGGADKTAKLWDTATGQLVQTFGDPQKRSPYEMRVAFSPDGARVLTGGHQAMPSSDDRWLKLWDAATGRLIRTLEGHSGGVTFVAFSKDSGIMMSSGSGYNDGLKFWDVETGRLLRTFRQDFSDGPDGVSAIAVSLDGASVLSGGAYQTLKLWDVTSERLIHAFEGRAHPIVSVAVSPDGDRVLSGSQGWGDTIRLWEAATGRLIWSGGVKRGASFSELPAAIAFSPDGARVVSREDKTLKLWDAVTGQLLRAFEGHADKVVSVALSPDGAQVASGGQDKTVKLWDTTTGQAVHTLEGHSDAVLSVAFSHDGARVVSGGKTVKVWDAATGRLVRSFDAVSALGRFKQSIAKATGGRSSTNAITAVAFSPDGTRVLSVNRDDIFDHKRMKLWDVATGRLISAWGGHSGRVTSVAFSPDGARVASGSSDNTVKLWEAGTGRLVYTLEGHSAEVASVAFSQDGRRIFSGSHDGTIRTWDTETGELITTLLAAKTGEWLVITPEGFFDASAQATDMLSIVRGLEVFGIEQFYQALYRPDLVREKLAGDPDGKVSAAAARLDLAKLLDSGPIPKVAITSHKAQDTSPADLVTMEARISDQGGGIGRAEWRINGITVGVVEQASGAASGPIALKQAMTLDPGDNIIELTAYNRANLVASVPARARITWTGTQPTAPPRLYVLVVGINDYLDAGLKLNYAVPDAKTLAAAFRQAGQGYYEDVIVTHVLDRNATAAKLDQVFLDLAAKVRPRDVFLFFAAGHGKTLDGRYYFIPRDLRYHTDQSLVREAIGQDKLQAWFARILAKKAVLMFDTCEAGSLTERRQTRGGLEQKAALGRLIQATGRATLTASTATQAAYEGHGGHGVFTFALLDALAHADTNNNGLVELTELIQHVDGLVPAITEKRWGARQFPQMDAYGSNFPLARQVAALAPAEDDAITIPSKPTHVSTERLRVFKEAGGSGGIVQQLPPFTTVTLVKSDRGWVLIARDGKALGYAAETKLHKLN